MRTWPHRSLAIGASLTALLSLGVKAAEVRIASDVDCICTVADGRVLVEGVVSQSNQAELARFWKARDKDPDVWVTASSQCPHPAVCSADVRGNPRKVSFSANGGSMRFRATGGGGAYNAQIGTLFTIEGIAPGTPAWQLQGGDVLRRLGTPAPQAGLRAAAGFRNYVTLGADCGLGRMHVLVNTDGSARYSVTVLERWSSTGGQPDGQRNRVVDSQPGGREPLGCSHSGGVPATTYDRQVTGEVRQ